MIINLQSSGKNKTRVGKKNGYIGKCFYSSMSGEEYKRYNILIYKMFYVLRGAVNEAQILQTLCLFIEVNYEKDL